MKRIHTVFRSTLLALAAVVIGTSGAHASATADPTSAPTSERTASFGPGRFGEVVVPMSAKDAIATGLMRWRNGPCGRQLVTTAPYYPQVFPITVVTAANSLRVVGVATGGATGRTQAGLGVGSTLRELRSEYGERLSPVRLGLYDVRYVEVRNGRQSLTFLFTDGTTSNGSKVRGMAVARGEAITGWDGC